jgi:hypothetical protein
MIKEILFKLFRLEELPCHSCETLQMQLSIANEEKNKLLNTILEMNKPKIEIPVEPRKIEPIHPKNVPWSVRRQMIEAEDRKAAELIAKKKLEQQESNPEIEELEKELGIGE